MDKFYTYCIINPLTCQPIYVGKGCGNRMYNHWTNRHSHRCNYLLRSIFEHIEKAGLTPSYVKVLDGVTSAEALNKEMELISKFGRLDVGTGCLCNLTVGGDGVSGASGDTVNRWRTTYMVTPRGKPVSQYTITGEYIATFASAKKAAEEVSLANRSYITQCCKGKRQTSGGYMWTYKDAPAPTYHHQDHYYVNQYTISGALIATHISVTHAALSVGVDRTTISACCRGCSKTSAGFVWKYVTTD